MFVLQKPTTYSHWSIFVNNEATGPYFHDTNIQRCAFQHLGRGLWTPFETVETAGFNLVLYNDEHNTFDHVIEMLISVQSRSPQAEQCALLVHFKGKCTVMSGTYDELEPVHDVVECGFNGRNRS